MTTTIRVMSEENLVAPNSMPRQELVEGKAEETIRKVSYNKQEGKYD